MNWLKKRETWVKVIVISIAGLLALAMSGCCPLWAPLGAPSTPTPNPLEWLQPPKGPAPTVAGQALEAEYLGRVHVRESVPGARSCRGGAVSNTPDYYRDLWRLSNNTSEPLAVCYEIRTRDARGILLDTSEWCLCRKEVYPADHLFIIPPGQSIVVGKYLCVEDVDAGATQELTTQALSSCRSAGYWNIIYDPDVKLVSFRRGGNSFTMIVENSGSRGGFAVAYIVAYDEQGEPTYGESLQLWGTFSTIPPGSMIYADPIPPGEKIEFEIDISKMPFFRWEEPQFGGYDILFLGLSQPLE